MKNSSSTADRFIPRRRGKDMDLSNYLVSSSTQNYENGSGTKSDWQKRIYTQTLWSCMFGLNRKDVLKFSDGAHSSPKYGIVPNQLWPVKPRKKPVIGKPVTILDMPAFSKMDWSKNGDLACIHEHEVYVWHENIQNAFKITETGKRVNNCIKWNNTGTRLAMGLKMSKIAIWNVQQEKKEVEVTCVCCPTYCYITCLVWTKANKLISTCSRGYMTLWTKRLSLLRQIMAHSKFITYVDISCNETYLVTSGLDNYVRIWNLAQLSEIIKLYISVNVKGLSFHPTREPFLVLGLCDVDYRKCKSSLILFNVLVENYIARKDFPRGTFIDALSFCPFSGELVVSYYFCKEDNKYDCEIAVHSDFDTKVDCMKYHSDRVVCLIWNKNTQELGTAGVDEDLCIWDFLGKANKQVPKKREKIQHSPLNILECFK
ncbi:protein cortex-like isoform X2 [Agrilus planipennis]|uniref:Protein cortex-like isoform X2 n=1 Tax=Agrilus planipennis TaxID=224129 RepID=A0A1W4WUW4_AGRPL|nr:protein cortex-like isoform X2 [Agrilus planipennis]